MPQHDGTPGTITRSLNIVRLLASMGRRGLALTDLSRMSGLPHPTVHRLLQQLISERMVRQIEDNRRYALGALAFEIGLAAADQFDIRSHCVPIMRGIAEEVGDTVYLILRSGSEAVCLDRCEGPSPIRVLSLNIGSRRPLGLGAGGLALLSALPDEERLPMVQTVAPQTLELTGLGEAELLEAVAATRKAGFAYVTSRVTLGVSAVGVPIRDGFGWPFAALSIAAVNARMPRDRAASLAVLLQDKSRSINSAVKAAISTGGPWLVP
ncbi:HTH-type transcriptional regulator KipR [Cupriavidus laharis]|uniref:HTH-type transcriptional regulator KipR n=1 Tax=Cupriavidus laharis TaxID=151654 RepID=A0ABN7YK30_9BURK|nr:IclR family transcriptional regulator [Cupriavidus laharis]CAG9173403.1 HTH-type transcriptional regulator KipR [Cupriavidus laharis]